MPLLFSVPSKPPSVSCHAEGPVAGAGRHRLLLARPLLSGCCSTQLLLLHGGGALQLLHGGGASVRDGGAPLCVVAARTIAPR